MSYPLVHELAADGVPVAVTCRVLDIARQPYYRWLVRPVTVRRIVGLRWRHRLGPVQIGGRLGVPASTVHAVLVRCRINRLSRIDRVTGEPLRRYEHDHPGSMIHVDFQKIEKNFYTAIYPVRVADADGDGVLLDVSESGAATDELGTLLTPKRRYAAAQTKRRLHQVVFRGQVLVAYATSCAVCLLHEPTLLKASHILGDADGGEPAVTNGLSLCTIHHRAYDRNLLGISVDARVHITPRLLFDKDGPMLLHGLQEMHGAALTLPRKANNRPDRDHLGVRFQQFRDAS